MTEENIEGLLTELDSKVRSNESKVWILRASPKWYRLLNALKDERIADEDVWEVRQHKNEILVGHIGIIWMAGKEAGIYAIVDIVSNPKLMVDSEASTSHWVHEKDKRQKRLRVKIKHLLKLTDSPIKKRTLEKIAGLGNLSILRYQQGTNFKVTKDEWLIISRLIRKKLETKA